MKKYRALIGCTFVLFSCTKKDDQVACTMEFRSIQMKVIGSALDDFYTIRLSTADTLRHDSLNPGETDYYTVLDDNFQSILKHQTETFRFVGVLNASVVVDEAIVIQADACHINYVSGNLEVTL